MKSKGLGDTIEKITTATGVKKFVHKITEVTGIKSLTELATKAIGMSDCGCNNRRNWLNQKFTYKKY